MRLVYQGFNRAGKSVAAAIDASTAAEATETLRRQGLFVTAIAPANTSERQAAQAGGGQGDAAAPGRSQIKRRNRLKNLAMFWRQLYVLTSTGTQLVPALHALERQTREAGWKGLIAGLRERVEEGLPLSSAMERHPEVFDAIYRALVAAGESSGNLTLMLDRLATLTRKRLQVKRALVSASVYPALLITVAVSVLGMMLMFVLPRFAVLFTTLGAPLPATTRWLIVLGEALRAYWWTIPLVTAPAAMGGRAWLRTESGRAALDTFLIRAPLVGPVLRSFATARIARVLGVLVEGHLPLLDALRLTREVAGNLHYAALIGRAEDAVNRGEAISTAFSDASLVSPSVYEALRSGEQTGQVGPLLLNIAEFLDEENEALAKSLTSILEPTILIGMGLMVGFIAVSMFLPLFDLTAVAGSG